MKRRLFLGILIVAISAGALAFRLPRLNERPMHGDEAVHAARFNQLWQGGQCLYDPGGYHGPTLYYFTLPSLWLGRAQGLADTTETTFRIVPVVFGVGLVLLTLSFGSGALGRPAAAAAAAMTAIYPAMVYYSRYYIHEMLLVFFTFAAVAAGWRYARSRRVGWALLCGACLGLMHATKETSLIAYVAMALALLGASAWGRRAGAGRAETRRPVKAWHIALAAAAAVGVSVVLLSGFFTSTRGPAASVTAYATCLLRAGEGGRHIHPWHYYLGIVLYPGRELDPLWIGGLVLALAALGVVAAFRPKATGAEAPLLRFLAIFTLFMTVAYSAIPYKTPWCMLSFLYGLILLAGVGAVALLRWVRRPLGRFFLALVLVWIGADFAEQARRANFRLHSDNRNPYVYAHPVTDVLNLAARVENLAKVHPAGHDMVVKIVAPDHDYWPLPWYLRRFNPERLGYYADVPDEPDAPLIIVSPRLYAALAAKLHDEYQTEYFGLRPHVLLLACVQKDLWNAFMDSRMPAAGMGGEPGPP